MAGRILPIALATVSGVAIGLATFKPEMQAQQRKRLEEDYQRDLAAISKGKDGVSPVLPSTTTESKTETVTTPGSDTKSPKLSDALGLWAWNTGNSNTAASQTSQAEKAQPQSKPQQ